LRWNHGYTADLRVERVEEPATFGFTWQLHDLDQDDPRRTYVEFTLEPVADGTLLTVVETGFAQLPDGVYRTELDAHVDGWENELGELISYLDAA
jgi:uncharacterized protein YndB with AHSA1/START domain